MSEEKGAMSGGVHHLRSGRKQCTAHHSHRPPRTDPATKANITKRIAEGHSKLDAVCALKRYIAREVIHIITRRQRKINQTRIAA